MIQVVAVKDAAFRENVDRMVVEFRRTLQATLKQQARLLAVKLAHITKPIGTDLGTRQKLERRIESDVRYMAQDLDYLAQRIDTATSEWGKALKDAMTTRDRVLLAKLIKGTPLENMAIVSAVSKEMHQRARTKGKVRSRLAAQEKQLVLNSRAVDSYLRQTTRKAGIAKGGWAGAANAVGGMRGIPQWITRHKARGTAIDNTARKNNPSVTLKNNVRYISEILSQADMAEAVRRQIRDFALYIDRLEKGKRRRL
jgi:hypothetical protein